MGEIIPERQVAWATKFLTVALIIFRSSVCNLSCHRSGAKNFEVATRLFEGAWGRVLVKAALLVGRSRDRSLVVSLGIFSVVPSDKTMCPEVDSASENEYQGFILG